MNAFLDAFSRAADQIVASAPALLAAFLVFVLLTAIGHAAGSAVARMSADPGRRSRHTALLRKGVRGGFVLVGLVFALQLLGLTAVATSLLATGGLLAVILGFAFREIGENLLAGIFLSVSRSFEVGDLVETSGHVGRVREIDLRQVWLRSADGRDIFVPSAEIFRNVLINFTRDGLRRGEFAVGIDYADPVMDAKELLLEVTRNVPDVLQEPEASVRVNEFVADYCELKVFFWVDIDDGPGLGEVRSAVMGACLAALREGGYTLSSDVSTAVSVTQRGPEA